MCMSRQQLKMTTHTSECRYLDFLRQRNMDGSDRFERHLFQQCTAQLSRTPASPPQSSTLCGPISTYTAFKCSRNDQHLLSLLPNILWPVSGMLREVMHPFKYYGITQWPLTYILWWGVWNIPLLLLCLPFTATCTDIWGKSYLQGALKSSHQSLADNSPKV